MKLSLIGIRWSVCGGRGERGGMDGGEGMGGVRLWGRENPNTRKLRVISPPSSSFSPNNEGWCMDRVSKVSAVASGP